MRNTAVATRQKRAIRTFSQDRVLVEEKRAELVLKACKVFITRGYDGTSMRELARELGKSTGAFYHYIGSKKDILYLILEFTVADQQAFVAKMRDRVAGLPPVEGVREAIRIYLESLEAYADLHVFVNHVMVSLGGKERRMMLDAAIRVSDFFEELLAEGMRQGQFQMESPRMVAQNIIVLGGSWVTRRWFWRKYYTLENYAREQTDLILRTMSPGREETGECRPSAP